MLSGQSLENLSLMGPGCVPPHNINGELEPWMVLPRQPMLPYLPAPPDLHAHPEGMPPELLPPLAPHVNHLMHVGGASQQQKLDHAHSPSNSRMTDAEAQQLHKYNNITDNNNQSDGMTSSVSSQNTCVGQNVEEYSPSSMATQVQVC